jgi:cohesin loading factor subunit SCC2
VKTLCLVEIILRKGLVHPLSAYRALTLSASNIELKIQAIKNLEGILCTEDSNISSISRRRNQSTLNTYIGLKVNYGSSSARIQIENGELDHSNAVYIQRYWKEILLLCQDDDSQVRVKTLCLVEIILRKGLVHPLSAYRALLELNLDQSKKIRKLALRILKAQYEKYTDLYYQQLSEAIEQLFKIITAKPCESRSTNDGKSTMKSHFFEEFHSEGFKNILGVLTGNRGGAMKVLEVIIKLIKKEVSEAANLHFIKFLSYLISYMTFTSNAEPTYATHQLHRVIVLHATELTRKVEEHSEPRLPLSDRFLITKSAMQVQKEAKNLSLCLNVIYQLKQYLQEKFKIRDEQLLPHMQSEKLNFGQLRVNENIEPLNITVTDVPLKYTEIAYHEHVSNLIDLVEPSFPQQK